ncbi:MAG: ABC transporter ATP-binding protein [Alphaproteobacteria bacterium]|nr:ABC transporter ATP-binding protein [Alphaproteobacteria bacterium]
MSAVVVENLVKRYGENTAVAGVSLRIAEGEVFALLGPNGAGKTSLVEILEGHRRRTSGTVAVLGHDPEHGGRPFRERIGIVLQDGGLEEDLSVAEAVAYHASLYPRSRPTPEVIALVGLEEKARARVGTLSGGQMRRLELALGIVSDPDLIFLDEPTTGFDPAARRQAWELVRALRTFGKTIVLTTHYMDEAQHLADRIAVIARGRIVAEGTPTTMGDRHRAGATVRFHLAAGVSPEGLPPPFAAAPTGWVEAPCGNPTAALHDLTAWATARGIELDGLSVVPPSLEDVYLRLVGEDATP